MPLPKRDPRTLDTLARAERRRAAQLKTLVAQGRVPLPMVVEDRAIRRLSVAQTICLCLTTRQANLDTRTHKYARSTKHLNRVLDDLGRTGDEKMSSLRPAGRARVAERLNAHRKATWNLREEAASGKNPGTDWTSNGRPRA